MQRSVMFFLSCALIVSPPAFASTSDDFAGWAFMVLSVLVIVLLILREVVCWYFKINSMLGVMTEIRDFLSQLAKSQSQANTLLLPTQIGEDALPIKCSRCGTRFESSMHGKFCDRCGEQL